MTSAWAYHPHPAAWAALAVVGVAYGLGARRFGPVRLRQVAAALGGLVGLALALTWPLGDLAARTSLTALVVQRLLLLLAVPPLLITGIPRGLTAWLTRPAPIDWVLRRCARPAIAVVVVTVVAVGTLTTGAVEAQASSPWVRGLFDLALLVAGFVLWTPILNELPGTDRPSALGRAGYLIVQSIVPSFLAIVWIFARHPLYPHYAHGPELFGVGPLMDQQMAGFVAKFTTIAVLWTVAFVSLGKAQQAVTTGRDPDPLLWSDVERHLERAERRERRRAWLPPSYRDLDPHPPRAGDTEDRRAGDT